MEHSFLLEPGSGGATVLDAYHNDTAYGAARPGAWALRDDELAAALPDGAIAIAFETAPPKPPAPGHRAPEPAAIASYLDAYRTHGDRAAALQRLTLETWLLTRARRLHAAQHAAVAGADPAVAEHLAGWAKLVEQTYIAHRRVERGRPEPAGPLDRLAELLTADQEVFGAPGAGDAPHGRPGASPAAPDTAHDRGDDLRAVVAGEAAAVLRVPAAELLSGAQLTSVGGFNSFRMVEIVERLEERLGVRFDADDLVPENLHDLDSLCRISQRARKERP
jgi:acyl carrier protein